MKKVFSKKSKGDYAPAIVGAIAGGLGVGAGLMFLLDPTSGARRRGLIRDKFVHSYNLACIGIDKSVRDSGNRIRGLVHRRSVPLSSVVPLHGENWPPAVRLAGSVAGLGLAVGGLRAPRRWGLALVGAGAVIVVRALTNLSFGRLLGLGHHRNAIQFQKTITLRAPIEFVFDFWTHFENFPRFMEHVREVRVLDEKRSHWKVAGPVGAPVEWDTEITKFKPNEYLAWMTLPGASVEHAGFVRFEPAKGGTRLSIKMSYNPPGGAIGHAIASLFRKDPKAAMDDDLSRMKSLIEEGAATGHKGRVTIDQLT